MTFWHDLSARARGLGAHLLEPAELAGAAEVSDPARLTGILGRIPYGQYLGSGRVAPDEVEEALRRRTARDLGVLVRWAGPDRVSALGAVLEEVDRESLRALIRGAAAGIPSEARLRGTLPTPSLPEERLREAAKAPGLEALARILEGWEHPLAPAVASEAARAGPDLFRVEVRLHELWAERSVAAGRAEGGAMRKFVEDAVDAENLRAVVSRARSPAGGDEIPFVEGGRWLDEDAFSEALRADGEEKAVRRLAEALVGSPFDGLLDEGSRTASLEETLLARRVERLTRDVRREPLGPGPVLLFVLRLRREVMALRRVLWGLLLDSSPDARRVAPLGGRGAEVRERSGPRRRDAGRGS